MANKQGPQILKWLRIICLVVSLAAILFLILNAFTGQNNGVYFTPPLAVAFYVFFHALLRLSFKPDSPNNKLFPIMILSFFLALFAMSGVGHYLKKDYIKGVQARYAGETAALTELQESCPEQFEVLVDYPSRQELRKNPALSAECQLQDAVRMVLEGEMLDRTSRWETLEDGYKLCMEVAVVIDSGWVLYYDSRTDLWKKGKGVPGVETPDCPESIP